MLSLSVPPLCFRRKEREELDFLLYYHTSNYYSYRFLLQIFIFYGCPDDFIRVICYLLL